MESLIEQIATALGISHDSSLLLVGFTSGVLLTALAKRSRNGENKVIQHRISRQEDPRKTPSGSISVASQLLAAIPVQTNISINGQSIQLDDAALTEIRQLLSKRDKIGAIKILREHTGLDLALSKAIVESIEAGFQK